MYAFDLRCRYVQAPKKPAEQISPEELARRIAELREAQSPKRVN
jgi:hypothetical protein